MIKNAPKDKAVEVKKKLGKGTIDWAEVEKDAKATTAKASQASKDALEKAKAAGTRRVLKRTNSLTKTALTNMHCCQLSAGDAKFGQTKKITLYTAV